MNITALLLTLATIIYISAKDKNIRASKYLSFMFLLVVLLHQINIKSNNIIVVFLAILFVVDEWLSYLPKFDKFNKMRRLALGESKIVEFETIKKIPLNKGFKHTENTTGIKTKQGIGFCTFTFISTKKGDKQEDYYIRDFTTLNTVAEGEILLKIKSVYGTIRTVKYLTGETFEVCAFECTNIESLSSKVVIESKMYV